MMKSLKAGFTLAEVLVTLMVIGVVAAMTIPTLLSSTDNQQDIVATKKAASVLSQAAQLIFAKGSACSIYSDATLTQCMESQIMGSRVGTNGDQIQTTDGMVLQFFNGNSSCTSASPCSLETACGSTFENSEDGYKGKGNCGVVVDVNGSKKGNSLASSYAFTTGSGFTSSPEKGTDIVAFSLSSSGARPMWFSGSTNPAYAAIYGESPSSLNLASSGGTGNPTCYSAEITVGLDKHYCKTTALTSCGGNYPNTSAPAGATETTSGCPAV